MAADWIEELIAELVQSVPPNDMVERKKSLSVNKITKAVEGMCGKVSARHGEKKAGFFRRAYVANKFKWGLREKAYPDDFVEMVTEAVIVALTPKKKQ
jgi:hypothetical protein